VFRHLHLHVISDEMIAPAMKTKKHYNSFRPDLGFFVPLVEVQRWLQQDEGYLRERVDVSCEMRGIWPH
jgi:aprataxin